MKTLPLFYYPTTWICVDDDHISLQTIGEIFSHENFIHLFSSSKDCLNFLKNYKSPSLKYNFISSDLNDENYGLLTKNPMSFDITKIAALQENRNRHEEITVSIIDYQMPEMNGLSLAEKMQSLPIQKILLTGNLEGTKAIDGFNNNLIQKYIQKASNDAYKNLSKYTKELSISYFEQLTKPLLTCLENEKKHLCQIQFL